jgi:hypothetical protein
LICIQSANQQHKPHLTIVDYMPIVQAPTREIDTLNTVVQKCMYISDRLGQRLDVLTVDQALYFKLSDGFKMVSSRIQRERERETCATNGWLT